RTIEEMIGRSDVLDMDPAVEHYKARGLDFSKIFYRPEMGPDVGVYQRTVQDHGLRNALDQHILADPQVRALLDTPYRVTWCPEVQHPAAVEDGRASVPASRLEDTQEITSARDVDLPRAEIHLPIRNIHRTVGAILGSEITRKYGPEGLPEDTVRL